MSDENTPLGRMLDREIARMRGPARTIAWRDVIMPATAVEQWAVRLLYHEEAASSREGLEPCMEAQSLRQALDERRDHWLVKQAWDREADEARHFIADTEADQGSR